MGVNSDTGMKNYVIPPFIWILALLEFTKAILIDGIYDIEEDIAKNGFCFALINPLRLIN